MSLSGSGVSRLQEPFVGVELLTRAVRESLAQEAAANPGDTNGQLNRRGELAIQFDVHDAVAVNRGPASSRLGSDHAVDT